MASLFIVSFKWKKSIVCPTETEQGYTRDVSSEWVVYLTSSSNEIIVFS